MRIVSLQFIVMAVLAVGGTAQSKGRELSLDDVLARTGAFMPRGMGGLAWMPDGKSFSWIERGPEGLAWVKGNVDDGPKTTIATDAQFAAVAKKAGLDGFPLTTVVQGTWRADGKSMDLSDGKRFAVLSVDPLALRPAFVVPDDVQAIAQPDDHLHLAYVKDYDITVMKPDGRTRRVTEGGFRDLKHGLSASREEFGIKDGMWWSKDGRRLAFFREDLRPIEPYPYIDWTKWPAEAKGGRYPMAGQKASIVTVGIYDTRTDGVIYLETDPTIDEFLTNITWNFDGDRVYVAHVNRTQDATHLAAYDAADGKKVADLFTERDAEWIEPECGPIFIPGQNGEFLWFSFRDGYRQLFRHAADGHLLQQVTKGSFDIESFVGFSSDARSFHFVATGDDPRHRHFFRADLAPVDAKVSQPEPNRADVTVTGAKVLQLTSGRGHHDVLVSPDGRFLLDRHSNLELPMAVDLLTADGKSVRRLLAPADPMADVRRGKQEFFTVKSPAGGDLFGHVIYPPEMTEGKKYPVLLYVYGGPHVQLVQDTWMLGFGMRNLWLEWMATQGYIVLRVDNHGTPNRGIAWQQAIHRRMGTLETDDQIAAIDYVIAGGHADPQRVGVHGWSYGGFMTLSLMTRAGDRFKCGVSGAPVTDWRFYETGYGERYMDTPGENPEGYKTAAVQNHVKGLKGRLLLVHGSSDETVVWQNTVDFTSACIREGIDFDYFIYPGQLHGLTGPNSAHFFRKMTAFFKKEL